MTAEHVLDQVDASVFDHHWMADVQTEEEPLRTWCGLETQSGRASDGVPVEVGRIRTACRACFKERLRFLGKGYS